MKFKLTQPFIGSNQFAYGIKQGEYIIPAGIVLEGEVVEEKEHDHTVLTHLYSCWCRQESSEPIEEITDDDVDYSVVSKLNELVRAINKINTSQYN